MDRETRKANLKKLQIPGTAGYKQRKTRQTPNSTVTVKAVISEYFLTPEKQKNIEKDLPSILKTCSPEVSDDKQNKGPHTPEMKLETKSRSRAKRTKLDAFIFKDPNNIPSNIKKVKNSYNDEDLIVSENKIKKAPKKSQSKTSKLSRSRKQTTIKSAFLRNEQLFAEIAAQHCAADQFDGDDVQLALAISKSEAESKGIKIVVDNTNNEENNVSNHDEPESIREQLKRYGFKTAEKKDYNAFAAAFLPKINIRRQKSKWANKFTALTLRSSEKQLKKLKDAIEKLLISQLRTKPLREHEKILPHYKLQSSLLIKSEAHENKRVLQDTENLNRPNELFFVTELFQINQLPAGHLLKDWTSIQGRDLTPNQKNKHDVEKFKRLECIYQDLDEYFNSRKQLNWSTSEIKDCQEVSSSKQDTKKKDFLIIEKHVSEIVEKAENEEVNVTVDLVDNFERIEEYDNKSSEINTSTSACDIKILQLLPTSKCLDVMQVSSCSIDTQATIHTTQKNRSNSPDLFADSDIEMEDVDKINDDNKTGVLVPSNSCQGVLCHVVDLTQDDLQLSNNNISTDNFNRSKSIVEIDLFAESPPQEEISISNDKNSNCQQSNYLQENKAESVNFTHSLESNEKKSDEILKLSPSLETQKQLEEFTKHKEDDDKILREIAMDQTSISFLNFEGEKQFDTSFHRKTSPVESDILKYNLTGNDTIFRELCNKYLNHEPASTSSLSDQENTDFGKSFSQILPTIRTPLQCDNFKYLTTDFDMANDKKITPKRKSISTTLEQKESSDVKINLSKSQSFNNSNVSIDLTQNDDEDRYDNDMELADEEDDECVVLSEDEINYSIWQADKTLNSKAFKQYDHIENNVSVQENIIEFPSKNDNEQNFSFLGSKDKEKSIVNIILGSEDSINNYDILTSNYATCDSPVQYEPTFDRNEFGVTEQHYDSIDYVPNLCTPTKILTEASFLSSPTETSAPMKRYSNSRGSSQKFQDLLNNMQENSPPYGLDEFNDFGGFDGFVSTSPLKTAKSNKKPQGIDNLLTAEIKYNKDQQTARNTKILNPDCLDTKPQEVHWNNKVYTVRYTFSPKPDYTKYTEAELLKELYNFGIKPLKRKQAVKMLEYIYNQTHPIVMEEREIAIKNRRVDVLTSDDIEKPCTSKDALKAQTVDLKSDNYFSISKNVSEKKRTADLLEVVNTKLNLQDSCGIEMLRYSVDLKAELCDEIYILQTNVTKKTPQPLVPLHIAWYNLVCSNRKLHETILMYEPIDLQEIYLFLKSLGYRYDPKDLKMFFDRRCIIFRYDLASTAGGNSKTKNTNRHIRGSKRKIKS